MRLAVVDLRPTVGAVGDILAGRDAASVSGRFHATLVAAAAEPGRRLLRARIGSHRRLERLSGELQPRIC